MYIDLFGELHNYHIAVIITLSFKGLISV